MVKEGWKEELEAQRQCKRFDETVEQKLPESIIETMARCLVKSVLDEQRNNSDSQEKEGSE